MKKILSIIMIIILLFLSSCDFANDHIRNKQRIEKAKKDFSQYFNGNHEVVFKRVDTLYYEGKTLDLDKILREYEVTLDGSIDTKDSNMICATIYENTLYISVGWCLVKDYSIFDFKGSTYALKVYKSDVFGENIEVIYEKTGYATLPYSLFDGNNFYVSHYEENTFKTEGRLIDKYNIVTGVYENVAKGEDYHLQDFKSVRKAEYVIETLKEVNSTNKIFVVKDAVTGKQIEVDDTYLMNTCYYEIMSRYGYYLQYGACVNGHILLIYGIDLYDVISLSDSYLFFEFDFESKTLEYKMIAIMSEEYDSYDEIFYIE